MQVADIVNLRNATAVRESLVHAILVSELRVVGLSQFLVSAYINIRFGSQMSIK